MSGLRGASAFVRLRSPVAGQVGPPTTARSAGPDNMSGRGVQEGDEQRAQRWAQRWLEQGQDGEQRNIARRVQELELYCAGYCDPDSDDVLSPEGLQEKIAGIPPDAVQDSAFFHRACKHHSVTLAMIECLLGAFPDAARSADQWGFSPLHYACENRNPDPGIVRLLLDRWPESINHQDNSGDLPLHNLCNGSSAEETALLAILDLLLAADPDSVTIVNRSGDLLIHLASRSGRPRSFCKRLLDAYPESLRARNRDDCLPIHIACSGGTIETVKYLIELYPESIDARNTRGALPIHYAAGGEHLKADIIRFLLAKDPDCASKTAGASQFLPLHIACASKRTCLDSVRILFDAYPEAINVRYQDGRGETPVEAARRRKNDAFVEFLEAQLAYARQAADSRAMRARDENGCLPLHLALRNNASLGAIKLLITGNRDALHVSDKQSAFPLHIACEFSLVEVVQYLLGLSDIHLHAIDSWRDSPEFSLNVACEFSSVDVVEHLLGFSEVNLHTLDLQKDSTLHYACRGGNLDVVNHLIEQRVPSVSEPNRSGKLPIHLLWESDRVDRDSVEYVDAVWRLLLARPETVTP